MVQKEYNRTIKFLVAINKGAFIVSYDGLEDCVQQTKLIADLKGILDFLFLFILKLLIYILCLINIYNK